MIVLDTNIVSELCREIPDSEVLRWYSRQPEASLFITSVTRGELAYGVLIMSPGRRRDLVQCQIDGLLQVSFERRQLSFDESAADEYAALKARVKRIGRPSSEPDIMIAAIAKARGFVVATRNVKDFAAFGLPLVNPFLGSRSVPARDIRAPGGTWTRNGRFRVKDAARRVTYQYRTN